MNSICQIYLYQGNLNSDFDKILHFQTVFKYKCKIHLEKCFKYKYKIFFGMPINTKTFLM